MKTLKIFFITALSLVTLSSCNSLLDINTKHALPQGKIKTEEGCKSLIIGVYDMMQDPLFAGRDMICTPDALGDNFWPSPGATKYVEQYYFQPRYNLDIWESAYRQIESLNEAIYYLKNLEQTNSVKALEGEALFLRAYDYFYLAIIYARVPGHLVSDFNLCVPLITEPFFNSSGNITEHASVSRATVDAVWAQIVQDLTNSFTYLNGNDGSNFPYRASAISAKALLSRVYLYMGDWTNTIEAATYVIKNSSVSMYGGTYTDIFSKGEESLWQLHYTTSENLASSSLHSAYGTVDDGVRDSDGYGDGIGAGDAQLSVTEDFVNLIDQKNDIRFTALRKVHYNGQNLWWTTKFNSWGGTFGLDDVPLLRISEIYLNRAEAYAHKEDYINARADVNALRNKRGIGDATAVNSQLLTEILLQRRIELAFEGHRFFDMKRLGMDITRPNGLATVPYDDYRVVAPISTSELDVNKALVNNPGY